MFHSKTVLLLLIIWTAPAVAKDMNERASARAASRWTLQEWLEQKDRNRMMDLWLSMNSPSPYEFMLGGASVWSTRSQEGAPDETSTLFSGEISAYARFVGLTVEYENNTPAKSSDVAGTLNLRLFGNSLQNSSLSLHGGQRTRMTDAGNGGRTDLRQLLAEARLQMYFSRHFGLETSYRELQPAEDSAGVHYEGHRTLAGLFIDFGAIRVFGSWSREKEDRKDDTGSFTQIRTDVLSGLRIYY